MINKFSDLASNERTYLSWIRTAIGILAFGFLVEKFELFFIVINKKLGNTLDITSPTTIEIIGVCMMIAAILMIIIATIRFNIQKTQILEERVKHTISTFFSFLLSGFLVLVAFLLVFYMMIRILPAG